MKKKMTILFFDRYAMGKIAVLYFGCVAAALCLDNPTLRNIFLLPGIVFWLRLSKEIYERKKLRRIFLRLSEWVFIVYVLHEMTLSSLRKICFRLFPATPLFWLLEYLLLPIVVMTGCVLAGMVWKRMMPGLYQFSTGER